MPLLSLEEPFVKTTEEKAEKSAEQACEGPQLSLLHELLKLQNEFGEKDSEKKAEGQPEHIGANEAGEPLDGGETDWELVARKARDCEADDEAGQQKESLTATEIEVDETVLAETVLVAEAVGDEEGCKRKAEVQDADVPDGQGHNFSDQKFMATGDEEDNNAKKEEGEPNKKNSTKRNKKKSTKNNKK